MCLVRSKSKTTYTGQGLVMKPSKGWIKPKTNLLERQSKRDLVPMRICAKLNPRSCLKGLKSFLKGQTKHVSEMLDYSLWRKNTRKPWNFAILYRKTLASWEVKSASCKGRWHKPRWWVHLRIIGTCVLSLVTIVVVWAKCLLCQEKTFSTCTTPGLGIGEQFTKYQDFTQHMKL